jgi:formylglycine-generating enzyme required for sulfatase activity
VYRGGTWDYSSAADVRAAFRFDNTPSSRYYSIGFRCAQRGARMPLKVTP